MIPVVSREEVSQGRINQLRLTSIRQYMRPGEMDVFIELVNMAKPQVVVEFGVNEGITANELLLRFIDIDRYVGIDVEPEYAAEISPQQRGEIPQEPGRLVMQDPRFELIVRRRGSLDLTAADLPVCDVAYIDGDHSYKVVKHDSLLAQRIVRQGGIIIWHDASNELTPDVHRALEVFHSLGWPIKQVHDTWLAFMRV
jgi:predicted O-methyltransferase YrrM